MFVVFEGIDGSGKTTVSSRVAKRLRAEGVKVEHVREDGEFASPLVRRLREFGKDPRNLALEPLAEVLLYLTREAQILAELTRPALERGEASLVFADRYLYSYEVLGCHGRGLPEAPVRAAIDAVADGLWPDLVVLIDCDPHIARARRRVTKIQSRGAGKSGGSSSGSRKGLAGVGANRRLREGYLELAQRDPERWVVMENGAPEVEVEALVERVKQVILARKAGALPGPAAPGANPPQAGPPVGASPSPDVRSGDAPARFFAAVGRRAEREPAVAAYFLAGLGHPEAHAWRLKLIDTAPHVVAYGLRGLGDDDSWLLRERLLEVSPHHIARSIDGMDVEGDRADALRLSLVDTHPEVVLSTLDGNDGATAWALRERLVERDLPGVVSSLKRLGSARAWDLRDRYLRQHGGESAFEDPSAAAPLAASVRGLDGIDAWRIRRLAFDAAPTAVLESLAGVGDDESWSWRARWIDRAPRIVLRTLARLDDPRAWAMRRRLAPRAKEALDSMSGEGGAEAWALREEFAALWPSTAVKSLGALIASERGQALAARALAAVPDDLSLLKHLTALSHDAAAAARQLEESE
jgi:dTMP kinase